MNSYTITIPGICTSMNVSLRSHWSRRSQANRDWYDAVAIAALGQKIPRPAFKSAIVEIELHYQVRQRGKRKADASNISKVTEDALVRCGIIADDSWPHLAETRLRALPWPKDEVVIIVRGASGT